LKKKKHNAVKVDHTNALIPKPTPELLLEVAMGIHLAVAGSACVSREEDEDAFPIWDDLSDETKTFWLEGARCAYSVIAIHGGAEVIKLGEPDA
jgi:hypothetical protein|tara:strand:+ start:2107 stop:2388 length:282 start_codon:yes stop_codon:yes gene_type:complete